MLAIKIFGTMFILGFLFAAIAPILAACDHQESAAVIRIIGVLLMMVAPLCMLISFLWFVL